MSMPTSSSGSEDDTVVILRKLGLVVPGFYALYYVIAVVLALALSLDERDDDFRFVEMPFYHDGRTFNPANGGLPRVTWLSQIITFIMSTGLMYHVVASTQKSWDYAATLFMIHIVASSAVSGSFPTNWIWWVTITLATFTLSSLGEIINYRREMQDIVMDL